jgi:hypothetical protein
MTVTPGDFAVDVLKAGIFVRYIQKVAPSVGEVTGLSSEITKSLKDQADKMGGESPFVAVFALVNIVSEIRGILCNLFIRCLGER